MLAMFIRIVTALKGNNKKENKNKNNNKYRYIVFLFVMQVQNLSENIFCETD